MAKKPCPKMITIRLDAEKDAGLEKALRDRAWQERTSVNRLIIEILKREQERNCSCK